MFLWLVARAAGVAAYAALVISVLSGLALRTDAFDALSTKKALRALHDFSVWIWIPLGAVHVLGLVLDTTARVTLTDVFVPFQTTYGQIAIGLGTLSFDITAVVVLTSWAKKRMSVGVWRWVHRTSYAAFALGFLHSVLSGTDFGSPMIGMLSWMAAAGVSLLALARVPWHRVLE